MKIMHRIAAHLDPEQIRQMRDLGFTPASTTSLPGETIPPLAVYVIDEAHPGWGAASELLGRDHFDSVETRFTRGEIARSPWLQLGVKAHTGYPEPDSDADGYKEVTYDLGRACKSCGIGRTQKAPFRMKSEPRWGQKGILQLNWVFGEIFTSPEIFEAVFEPHGIACREVEDTRGNPLASVVQLRIDETVDVDTASLPSWECPECGSVLYYPVARGPFPRVLDDSAGPIVRTRQFFSGGGWGDQLPLVRADLAGLMRAAGVKGAVYVPTDQAR